MTTLFAILAAVIPTAIYGMLIWWLDRYEKEPLPLIAVAFLWGSLPAIGLVVVIGPLGPHFTVWRALVEESAKALALVGLFMLARYEFDGPLDGIVYGSLVGFGYEMTENLLYFLLRPDTNLGELFWVRSVFFGLNHALFTSIVGLALGAVRYRRSSTIRLLALGGGLALAVLFHTLHNYAVARPQLARLFFSWVVEASGVIVIFAIAVLAWRHERRWIEQELGDEVRAGAISAADYAEIASPARRVRRQSHALLAGGWTRYRQTRRLHHLATELAFCKSQLRLDDCHRTYDECDRLRGELIELRAMLEREERIWSEL